MLVTGATGGLGSAVVAAFLDDGWRVVAASRSGRP
ncbi:MAG TPA: NAD-dependent epimerase/dehydratase family protein, partial [Actinomycetes bacterium]|nr:NAD-dependent epimerase/dehydratase family protein [Actinomycetes bacterium]